MEELEMSSSQHDLAHRHSLTDEQWEVLQPLIVYPPIGRPPENEQRTMNGILWILKTGAPWRDLPKEFGYWNSVYQRFLTFTMNGNIQRIFQALVQMKYDLGQIDLEFTAIDGSIVRVHKAAAGASSEKSKKKGSRKTMPSGDPEVGQPQKSSLPANETSSACP
jgi:transposase